jgi:hypothetical protein
MSDSEPPDDIQVGPYLLSSVYLSAVLSVALTVSHLFCVANLPALLLFVPLTKVFPQLSRTGPNVQYGFLGAFRLTQRYGKSRHDQKP